jgi:antirestriction protein ArdC
MPGLGDFLFREKKSPGGARMAQDVRKTLNSILEAFKSGSIPEAIAYSMFPLPDLPSSKWSLLNRIAIFLSGTPDARGFRQWNDVGRHVKRGAKAIYILVPRMIKREIASETGEAEEEEVLAGFMGRPVFRVEDTDGEPLDYEQIELPPLPLIERAKEWGLSVKAVPGNYQYHGYFCQDKQEIGLASKDEAVFFHELAHAAHQRIAGDLRTVPPWEKEVVAELAAAALCKIVGKNSKYLGTSYQYIRHYAEQEGLSPVKACLRVINQTEAVLSVILQLAPSKKESGQVSPYGPLVPETGALALEQAAL